MRCSHLVLTMSPAPRDLIQCKTTPENHILSSRTPRNDVGAKNKDHILMSIPRKIVRLYAVQIGNFGIFNHRVVTLRTLTVTSRGRRPQSESAEIMSVTCRNLPEMKCLKKECKSCFS